MPIELNAGDVRGLLNLVSSGKTLPGVCWLLETSVRRIGRITLH